MVFAALMGMLLLSCNQSKSTNSEKEKAFYGEEPNETVAVDVNKALVLFKDSGKSEFVVKSEIKQVCQSEGCWFSFKTEGADLFVDFDEKFTVPKDIVGKVAVAKGTFYHDTTTVETLKEYAKEDGKSEEEISKITEPEIKINFKAAGVKFIK